MFSLFTFKSELKRVFSRENIDRLREYTVETIVYYVNKDLLGSAKKEIVTRGVINFISTNFVTKNSIVAFFVQLLIQFTPNIVQYLYDSLKRYVEGLTEKTV